MKKQKQLLIYRPKALVAGGQIEAGLSGYYAAVPDRGYKGHPFKIEFMYPKMSVAGDMKYVILEMTVNDYNKAERFRRFMDKWGRGAYTLGYFKMAEAL